MRKQYFTITSMKSRFGRYNYLVILLLRVLKNYIITRNYQQSRKQKRVGCQLARSPLLQNNGTKTELNLNKSYKQAID